MFDDLPPKSKSQLKREMTALQEMGERLVKLKVDALARLELPENLAAAIAEAKRITSHEGKRRQMQYIGRLMRSVDPEPIIKVLNEIDYHQQQSAVEFQLIEKWRDRLLTEGKPALTEFLAAYPFADSQRLRHLLQAAEREQQQHKPASAARALFCYIREIQQQRDSEC